MGFCDDESCAVNPWGPRALPTQPPRGPADSTRMPCKRLVLVLVAIDAERWEANAFVRGVSLDRFVREAVEHRIRCHAKPREQAH